MSTMKRATSRPAVDEDGLATRRRRIRLATVLVRMMAVACLMPVASCASSSTASGARSTRESLPTPDSQIEMMARIRQWRFDSGEFISVAAVDLAEGVALQPHALSGASGISNDRFLTVYPIAPGSMIEVIFQSTAETRFRVEKDLEALDAQVRDGEVGEEVANRVRERCQRAMKKLKRFEAECIMQDLPRCHAIEARLKQFPVREWLELVEAGADIWIDRELPIHAARLFEAAAAARVDAEQYFWRAAASYAAGGMQERARVALARFRAAATPEQLAEAAEAVRDLEREIEDLGKKTPSATSDSK